MCWLFRHAGRYTDTGEFAGEVTANWLLIRSLRLVQFVPYAGIVIFYFYLEAVWMMIVIIPSEIKQYVSIFVHFIVIQILPYRNLPLFLMRVWCPSNGKLHSR